MKKLTILFAIVFTVVAFVEPHFNINLIDNDYIPVVWAFAAGIVAVLTIIERIRNSRLFKITTKLIAVAGVRTDAALTNALTTLEEAKQRQREANQEELNNLGK